MGYRFQEIIPLRIIASGPIIATGHCVRFWCDSRDRPAGSNIGAKVITPVWGDS
jgi:hypothetical protein